MSASITVMRCQQFYFVMKTTKEKQQREKFYKMLLKLVTRASTLHKECKQAGEKIGDCDVINDSRSNA